MICAQCHRPMKSPAIQIGRVAFGPVCARRLGLIKPIHARSLARSLAIPQSPVRDDRTPDLFKHLEAHE